MKVLIVEDNSRDRKLLRYYLEGNACEVAEAQDGQEGLAAARKHTPDLIISDAMMPVMDGFRLLREVRNDGSLKDIPFVFYTAIYTGKDEEELALSLGADALIVKPRGPEEFWKELLAVLERRKEGKDEHAAKLIDEEGEYLRRYCNMVVIKLEEKVRELEKMKEALETSEKSYKDLFDLSLDGVFHTGRDGICKMINEAGARMFGYDSPEEMIGRSVKDHYANPDDRVSLLKELDSRKSVSSYYLEGKRRDGTVMDLEVSSRLLEDGSVTGILRDITVRRQAEEELKNRVEELEKFYEMAVGRELRMKELKEERVRLLAEIEKYRKNESAP